MPLCCIWKDLTKTDAKCENSHSHFIKESIAAQDNLLILYWALWRDFFPWKQTNLSFKNVAQKARFQLERESGKFRRFFVTVVTSRSKHSSGIWPAGPGVVDPVLTGSGRRSGRRAVGGVAYLDNSFVNELETD